MKIKITRKALHFIYSLPYMEFCNVTEQIIPALILRGLRKIDKPILESKLYKDRGKETEDARN